MSIATSAAPEAVNDNLATALIVMPVEHALMSAAEIGRGMSLLAARMGFLAQPLYLPETSTPNLIVPPSGSLVVAMDARRGPYRARKAQSRRYGSVTVIVPGETTRPPTSLLEARMCLVSRELGLSVMLLNGSTSAGPVQVNAAWAIYAWYPAKPRVGKQSAWPTDDDEQNLGGEDMAGNLPLSARGAAAVASKPYRLNINLTL